MRDWIKRIIETLQYLRVTDGDKAVFGSWHHGYRLDSPLPHGDIRKLEETMVAAERISDGHRRSGEDAGDEPVFLVLWAVPEVKAKAPWGKIVELS